VAHRTDGPARRLAVAAQPVAVLAVLALAACSNGSKDVVHPPRTPLPSSAVSSATPSGSESRASKLSAKVTPATGLSDKRQVQVDAAGFTAGEALTVIECAQKGNATGPGDCNLSGMTPATADGLGNISVQLTVLRGPFGANKIVCSTKQPCLVSVTQASLTPTEEADAPISFKAAG
jgi:heat shock protein HslJ